MITEKQVISHLYKDDGGEWIIQTNEEHQKGVAEMAAEFAAQFGYSSWGYALGMLHDYKGQNER